MSDGNSGVFYGFSALNQAPITKITGNLIARGAYNLAVICLPCVAVASLGMQHEVGRCTDPPVTPRQG